ncbi:DUF3047 domain-containing protein [Desulfopila sp. IMCC35008]|uniref:DUF3047 domain-containing protein n=1 Tax=Desulfopila sp. IMCC35008 TaxID=2653858 RepID=UPI0013D721D6|nr:DUF3047 domain-containing protein [Desulfopila sp. IMCC35008]
MSWPRNGLRYMFLACYGMLVVFCSHSKIFADSGLLDESFRSLEQWEPFTFHGIDDHSSYRIVEEEKTTCLEMRTAGGASALILKTRFDVYNAPILSWRWKVDNIYAHGNYLEKQGDDYPARLYVIFAYDPEKASWSRKLKYTAGKVIYGEYPPDSTLNYIWANRPDAPDVITNVYVDRAKMIPVDRGARYLNQWRNYEVDIVADYEKAFGAKPPRMATLGVMIDGDNTGEVARSCIDFIRLSGSEVR